MRLLLPEVVSFVIAVVIDGVLGGTGGNLPEGFTTLEVEFVRGIGDNKVRPYDFFFHFSLIDVSFFSSKRLLMTKG